MGNNETKITVGVFYTNRSRHKQVGQALIKGILKMGDAVTKRYEKADVIITYGLGDPHPKLHNRARKDNKPNILVDFGYWEKNYNGLDSRNHYRISMKYPHPDKYILHMGELEDRFLSYNKTIQSWKMDGDYILLADIGRKSYGFFGMEYQSWAKEAISTIQKYTDRPIVYRPKPSSSIPGKSILGLPFSDPLKEPIKKVLEKAYAVVTYHSNVGCDALLAGVPIFVQHGAALPMALQDLSKIETPFYPTLRFSFFCNLAYCQWNVNEIQQGLTWKHIRDKLIPLVYEEEKQ